MSTNTIPVIPLSKHYWLVRTHGGRYYDEFRRGGFIGINWCDITFEDIDAKTRDELTSMLKDNDPDVRNPQNASRQLHIFRRVMKPGDTIIITGRNSSQFSIGEVAEDGFYVEDVSEIDLEENPSRCPYQKRRKVRWIKQVSKYDVQMPMFKLLQHAQHTITDAEEYKDVIESMVHDFFIRGDYAQLTLKVRKDGHIPALTFFSLGKEVLELAEEFMQQSELTKDIDLEQIETQININSPGSFNFRGNAKAVAVIGLVVLLCTGGGVSIPLPATDVSIDAEFNGLIPEVRKFLNDKQEREHRDLLLREHMDDLEIESPEDLQVLLKSTENDVSSE